MLHGNKYVFSNLICQNNSQTKSNLSCNNIMTILTNPGKLYFFCKEYQKVKFFNLLNVSMKKEEDYYNSILIHFLKSSQIKLMALMTLAVS